jgi:hypothetical protein
MLNLHTHTIQVAEYQWLVAFKDNRAPEKISFYTYAIAVKQLNLSNMNVADIACAL